jgi:hypothetical protein
MDSFSFNHHFTLEETMEIFHEEEAWNYKNNTGEESLFKGALIGVKNVNIKLTASEVLGSVNSKEFIPQTGSEVYAHEKEGLKFDTEKAIAIQCSDGILIITKDKPLIFPKLQLPLNIIKVDADINRDKRIEGYWYSKYSPQYLMPQPNQLNETEAEEIYKLIKYKEVEAKRLTTRGVSYSRIDDTCVGNGEYHHTDWLWPESLAPHYVFKYKVKPSDDFLKFIGWDKT